MKNKILSFVLALCLIIPCALVFTACGKDKEDVPTFTVNQNVLTLANDSVEKLQMVYNRAPSGTFSLAEMKATWQTPEYVELIPAELANFSYYIEVGEVDEIDDVNSITLGSTFTKNQKFKLSLGNNAHLEDKVFYENDDKIYVAAPIIVFETVNLDKIKINNVEFAFDLQVEATATTFTNATFSGAGTVTDGENDGEFNLNITDCTNSYLKLYFEGAEADDIILTKKVCGDGNPNYGLTDLVQETNNPLGFYPIGWAESINQTHVDNFNGKTLNYQAYVIGSSKLVTGTLNLTVTLA